MAKVKGAALPLYKFNQRGAITVSFAIGNFNYFQASR
jgi:hypothetical protein